MYCGGTDKERCLVTGVIEKSGEEARTLCQKQDKVDTKVGCEQKVNGASVWRVIRLQ